MFLNLENRKPADLIGVDSSYAQLTAAELTEARETLSRLLQERAEQFLARTGGTLQSETLTVTREENRFRGVLIIESTEQIGISAEIPSAVLDPGQTDRPIN